MNNAGIAQKVDIEFKEELQDKKTNVSAFINGRLIGVCKIETGESRVATTDLRVFEEGQGYSRPIIGYVISILRKKGLFHCVYLNEKSEKLRHIFEEKGYFDEGFLCKDYA